MQTIKDSFYIALRDRLAALNPSRVVTVLGVMRPAVLATENLLADAAPLLAETFYLNFGEITAEPTTKRLEQPLLQLACEITYWTQGSDALSGQDRGRTLAQLDCELLAITSPPNAALADHSRSPAVALGRNMFWTSPTLGVPLANGSKLTRAAALQLFAYAEAAQ